LSAFGCYVDAATARYAFTYRRYRSKSVDISERRRRYEARYVGNNVTRDRAECLPHAARRRYAANRWQRGNVVVATTVIVYERL